MVSLLFRKCFFRTQMRQYSIAFSYNRNQIKSNIIYCWADLKHTNYVKYNASIYRMCNSASNKNQQEIKLEPLMDVPITSTIPPFFTLYKTLLTIFLIQFKIDREFSINEYNRGTSHAATMISNALASQNYEALEGLVESKTLQILKNKVSSLNQSQRNRIAIQDTENILYNVPTAIEIIRNQDADDNEVLIKISHLIQYVEPVESPPLPQNQTIDMAVIMNQLNKLYNTPSTMSCNYIFERRYRNGVGDAWTATVVNHFTNNTETD